jgi:hypothetical protein
MNIAGPHLPHCCAAGPLPLPLAGEDMNVLSRLRERKGAHERKRSGIGEGPSFKGATL